MQNLYNVDPTGKAYTLDVAPLLAADNKRAAGEMAKMQALGSVANEGFKAAENYQARKQLANLATSASQLKPGTPEFEQQVAQLVFQNPLAFNNPNTANTAKAGLSAMGNAHAEAMKTQYQDRAQEFQLRRDQANYGNQMTLAKERYKARNGTPIDANALFNAIEGGASTGGTMPPDGGTLPADANPLFPADPNAVPNEPPMPDDNVPVSGELLAPVDEEVLPPDGGPLPAPGDSAPVGEEGAKGPAGVEGLPSATVKLPATAKAPTTKGVTIGVDSQAIDLKAKADKYEAAARALEHQDQPAAALAAASKAADYKAAAIKLANSPEAVAERQKTAMAAQKELETARVADDAPVIADALSEQYSDLPAGWQKEMKESVADAKTLPALQAKQKYWSDMMANATQASVRGEAIPEKPSDYKKLSTKESAYRATASELRAAENDLIKIKVPTSGGNKPDVEKAIVDKRAEIEGLKTKLTKAGEDVTGFKKELGLLPPDPVKEPPAAKELSPYEKALENGGADARFIRTPEVSMNRAKDLVALDYPDVMEKIKKVAMEKPFLESAAIKELVAPWVDKKNDEVISESAKSYFQGVDPKDVIRSIIKDIRAKNSSVPSTDKFDVKIIK